MQIFIRESLRREGYGTLLLEKLESMAKTEKKESIVTFTGMRQGSVFGDFLIHKGFINKGDRIKWEKSVK